MEDNYNYNSNQKNPQGFTELSEEIQLDFEPQDAQPKSEWSYPPKKAYQRVGLGLFAFSVLFYAIVLGIQIVYALFMKYTGRPFEGMSVRVVIILNTVVEAFIAAPVCWLIIKKIPTIKHEGKKFKFGSFISCICMTYTISIAGSILAQIVNSFLADSVGVTSTSGLDAFFNNDFIWMAILAVFVAPVIEEIVFRKFVIDKLQVYSEKYAILLSGLAFGLMHGNLEQFFYAFFLGLMFAFVYVRTGKLRYTIAMHFIFNGISTVLTFLMSKVDIFNNLENLTDDSQLFEALLKDEKQLILFILVACIALAQYVMAFIGFILFIVKRKEFVIVKREQDADAKTAFLNYGIILAFAAMIGLMILSMYM